MNIAPAPSPYSPSPLPYLLAPPLSALSSSSPAFNTGASSSSLDANPYSASLINGPYMGVVLVVLFLTFFLMAAFSVYMRRYAIFALDLEAAARSGANQAGRGMGLDRATIDGLPMVVYHCAKGEKATRDAAAAAQAASLHEWSHRPDCVVCLADFQEAENLRVLPRCEHCFHSECIDMWLYSHSTCPLCRLSLLQPAAAAAAKAAAAEAAS